MPVLDSYKKNLFPNLKKEKMQIKKFLPIFLIPTILILIIIIITGIINIKDSGTGRIENDILASSALARSKAKQNLEEKFIIKEHIIQSGEVLIKFGLFLIKKIILGKKLSMILMKTIFYLSTKR